ncbi:MAG: hypothetical protein BYD32DRAFT_431684 [Podila humilis]|nr:MAG: hypothetical protein BYD32DRAFT_431684 [Podila humilis]
MKAFLKLSLLVVALLSTEAAVAPTSMDAKIADFYFKGCVPGTTKTIPLEGGATEYSCTKVSGRRNGSNKHELGTNLFVSTSQGGIDISIGGNGVGVSGTVYGFQFSGYVDSAWGTSRAVVYPSQKSIDAVDKLPKRCSSDSSFCFDSYEGTCEFFFSNKSWEKSCPLLKVIQFSVDA